MEFIHRIPYNPLEVHPLHTMVVHFPIALTGAALFFLLVTLFRHRQILEKAAFANMTLAAISKIVGRPTRMRDNIDLYDGAASNAGTTINLAILLLRLLPSSQSSVGASQMFSIHLGEFCISLVFWVCFAIADVLGFLGGVILYGF